LFYVIASSEIYRLICQQIDFINRIWLLQVQTSLQNLTLNKNIEGENITEGDTSADPNNTNTEPDQTTEAEEQQTEANDDDAFTINIPGNNKNNNSKVSRAKKRKVKKKQFQISPLC